MQALYRQLQNYGLFDINAHMTDRYAKYKIMKLPNVVILHWVLNPGLCINELILGQRLPKATLIDETSDEPLSERSYVECPSCETIHNLKLWGKGNGFRHYNGLYCPICEEKIPSLLNVFSILLLVLTFPLWKPAQLIYGERFKAWELVRLRANSEDAAEPVNASGMKMGLSFGAAMGVFFLVQAVLIKGWSVEAVCISIVSALLAGVFFGMTMKFVLSRKGRKSKASS